MFSQCGTIEKISLGIDEAKITYTDKTAIELSEAFHKYDLINYNDSGVDYRLIVSSVTDLEVRIQ